ncbi:MAG: peroxiredoxin family protein [Solirubrobacteraceae bacterium]
MASRRYEKERLRRERLEREAARAERARKLRLRLLGATAIAVAALAAVFALSTRGGGGAAESQNADGQGQAGEYAFAVGNPGPGERAPAIELPSTEGGTYELAKQRGKRVLLYFQEGLMCQPCWDQITDLEQQPEKLRALGIDQLVSITTDPLPQLEQKVEDEGIEAPVLSDPDLSVSVAYEANQYGMMGESRDGHSLLVIGPNGRIEHRADYGGPPDHTMYVPVDNLIADLRAGMRDGNA